MNEGINATAYQPARTRQDVGRNLMHQLGRQGSVHFLDSPLVWGSLVDGREACLVQELTREVDKLMRDHGRVHSKAGGQR